MEVVKLCAKRDVLTIFGTRQIQSLPMSTTNTCANCGKGEENSGDLKACTACKLVKYCNRECQIAHRPQHKKSCKKRAAELHDEALFKEPPPPEECPICMLPPSLYTTHTGMTFHSCCGKRICNGCEFAMVEREESDILCPFCRIPSPNSDNDSIRRLKKLMEKGNGRAFYILAGYYARGIWGLPQDRAQANELFLKAGELGCAEANYNLGIRYTTGNGVEVDKKKAMYYYELAAMNGHMKARHNLGCNELEAGNHQRAMKHLLLAAKAGHELSLNAVKGGYMNGVVTKEEYANTLRSYQQSQEETKSDARDKAQARIS